MSYFKIFALVIITISTLSFLDFNPQYALAQNKPTIACTQYPKGIDTPSVKDPKIVDQEDYKNEGATWEYRWEADCTTGCSKNSDCTTNNSNSAVAPGTSPWCFEFTDGNRCMILTTTDKKAGEDTNKSGGKFGKGNAKPKDNESTSSASLSPAQEQACREATQVAYYDAKVANNLVRFYAIQKGVAELCVPADLGVGTQENASALDGSSGRLLLCSGKAKDEGLPDLVWKVIVGNSLKTANKEAPTRETIEQGFAPQIGLAKKAVGL